MTELDHFEHAIASVNLDLGFEPHDASPILDAIKHRLANQQTTLATEEQHLLSQWQMLNQHPNQVHQTK